MKSSKIPFISQNQSHFQRKFFSEYFWYGILGILAFVFLMNGVLTRGIEFVSNSISAAPQYQKGDSVKLEGEILQGQVNGLISFEDSDGTNRWLKSKDLDIIKYKGKAVIEGYIDNSEIDENFVIEVNKIYKILDPSTGPKIITKYMSLDNNLQIDLSNNSNYFVDLDLSGSILIKDLRTFRPIMKITPFTCMTEIANQDCGKIVYEGDKQNKFDTFLSLYSLKYYKINEGLWFVDNKEGKGYHLATTADTSMYQLSEYISFLNKDRVASEINARLSTLCTDTDYTMKESTNIELKKTNNNWFAIVKGLSQKDENIQCEIYLDDTSKQGVNFELRNVLPI
jgi:hypothetical protein